MQELLSISTDFIEKSLNKFVLAFSFILALFSPIKTFYHVIVIFILLNFISGLLDDLKRGEKFSWPKFKTFMLRILFYILTITMVYLFEKYIISEFGVDSKYLTAMATGLISLYEIRSFLINAGRLTGNPVFVKIFEKLNLAFKKRTDADQPGQSANINQNDSEGSI
jgi:hypothetical protein